MLLEAVIEGKQVAEIVEGCVGFLKVVWALTIGKILFFPTMVTLVCGPGGGGGSTPPLLLQCTAILMLPYRTCSHCARPLGAAVNTAQPSTKHGKGIWDRSNFFVFRVALKDIPQQSFFTEVAMSDFRSTQTNRRM